MTTVKYIVHTADIHIGHPGRDDEYLAVFQQFADSLPCPEDTLIVIAGDIFHHKTRYSGADVHLFNRFMEMLGKYQVIIIPGNHDTNMNNLDAMDLITPVMEKGRFPNVHYWKYTGDYVLRGIKFYHVSVFGTLTASQDTLPTLTTAGLLEKASRDTILLYHGMVNGVVYGTQVASERLITREVMSGFGCVMLGDIHQHQFLLPNAAYPGSLIQQNVAESQDKGYLLWDFTRWHAQLTSRMILIPNNSGFVKLDFRGMSAEEIAALIESRPLHDKMLKVSVVTDDAAPGDHLAAVEAKFGRIDVIKKSSADTISAAVVGECLRGLLIAGGMDEQSTETCVADYVSQIVTVARGRWYVTRIEWDNLFKYGPGNVIDFRKLSSHNGISGVIAGNHRGKSSIFDIIVFGLFNEHLRGKSVQDIIRKEATGSRVSIEFVTGETSWRVTRVDNRTRHIDLKMYRKNIDDKGIVTWVNCTADNAVGTYQQIARLIGTFAQLMATGMYYDVGYELTRKKSSDCLTMMTGLIGLDCNEKISAALDENITKLNKQIAGLPKPRVTDDAEIVRLRNLLEDDTNAQSADESALDNALVKLNEYQKKLAGVQISDAGILAARIESVTVRINALDQEIAKMSPDMRENNIPVVWRDEWAQLPTATSDEMDSAKILLMKYICPAGIEKRINELTIDAAVKAAASESLKLQIKARGNPSNVNRIPSLKAEITRLSTDASRDITIPTICSGVDRAHVGAEIARLTDIIAHNQPISIDLTNEATLQRNLQLVDADISKLQSAASTASARQHEKLTSILASLNGFTGTIDDLNVEYAQLLSAEKIVSDDIANIRDGLKLVEHDALVLHIEGLRSKSGLNFADDCTVCAENKHIFCDGLMVAEIKLGELRTHNNALAARICELSEEMARVSARLTTVNTKITLMNELATIRLTIAKTTEGAASQMADLSTRRDEWANALANCKERSVKITVENARRAQTTADSTAEKNRLINIICAFDTWDATCRSVAVSQDALEKARGDLLAAESMLEMVKQYGVASADAKDSSAELLTLKTGLTIVYKCENVTAYQHYMRRSVYDTKIKAREKTACELADLREQQATIETYIADINARETCYSVVDKLRRVITDRAVAIGVAQRDFAQASAEVDILRSYEREYPLIKDKLDMYKKYRAVVKSGGLKAGVVNRYLEVIVGRANDMLKTISAGFALTCGVDSSGVTFSFREGARELSLALASGFQRFISALTFRMALISVLPASPSFIMIDEGFGCMDDTNLAHAIEFLETCVLRDFEFVFVISHKEELRNTIRSPLCIRGDDVSLLNNTGNVECAEVGTLLTPRMMHDTSVTPAMPSVNTMPPVCQQPATDSRIQCECGALVLKKSLRSHLNSTRHKNTKK